MQCRLIILETLKVLKIIARIPINRLQEMTAGKKKVMRRDWVAANGESGGVLWRG